MGPTSGPETRPPSRRDAILDAALALFGERSFDGTPVPLVAERAGVGAGTIYRYFESKEALVNAVYRRCKLELLDALTRDLPADPSPRQEFRWLWCGLWAFASERAPAFRFLETQHHARYLDAESGRVAEALDAPILDFIRRGQQADEIRALAPEILGALVLGAFVGLFKAAQAGSLELSPAVLAGSEQAAWDMISSE
jgi:AcrR family transcriptional regulator